MGNNYSSNKDPDSKRITDLWSSSPERQDRLRDLVRLAKDQGYLTYDDLNRALPESVSIPEEIEAVMTFFRTLEIDIIDFSEIDSYKQSRTQKTEIKKKSDFEILKPSNPDFVKRIT